jgi:hypothetical protein
MPNIDFYAANADFDPILTHVFSISECRVFESYSPFGQELAEFTSIDSIASRYAIGVCKGTGASVLLQLVPPNAMDLCRIERVNLNPAACDGHTFRYRISGWGLIQLYLGGVGPHGMVESHGNHFTELGAQKWEQSDGGELGAVAAWDWRRIAAISSALNRFIRSKLARYKLGSRPVLPDAAAAFESGVEPVSPGGKALLRQYHLQRHAQGGATG